MLYLKMAVSHPQDSNFRFHLQPAWDWKGYVVFLASYELALMPLKTKPFYGPETDFL